MRMRKTGPGYEITCSTNGQPLRKRFMIRFRAQWLEYPPSSILVQPDLRPILDDYDIYFHDFYV